MTPTYFLFRAIQKISFHSLTLCWSLYYNLILRLNPAVRIKGWLRVTGRSYFYFHPGAIVRIGKKVTLNSGSRVNPVGGQRPLVFSVGKGAELTLEDEVGISSSTLVSVKSIVVGKHTLIGGDCCIYDSDFHSLSNEARRQSPDTTINSLAVKIGAEVFLGTTTLVLKGAVIGDRAVVGAGSLVIGSVPADELWLGRPARFSRRLDAPTKTA